MEEQGREEEQEDKDDSNNNNTREEWFRAYFSNSSPKNQNPRGVRLYLQRESLEGSSGAA